MKKKILFIIVILSSVFFISNTFADLSIFSNTNDIIYCPNDSAGNSTCSLTEGTNVVKNGINDIEKNKKASVYIQDIVKYLLTFITIIAVIYIVYAGFKILTSAGKDDEIKNSKNIIISVAFGILIIWLAYAIVTWILGVIT
ncbi:MAG: hypothetical protein PHE25_00895 [Candidatus Gracilibacteria bacterium]|nr:hypothetical protein [Candidatus Gracilibacteria bacterium]